MSARRSRHRETINRSAEIDYTHKKQTGGAGQYARIKIRFAPLPPGQRVRVREPRWSAAPCRRNTCPASRRAALVNRERRLGRVPGHRSEAELIDGAYHDVDSSVWPSRSPPGGLQGRRHEGGAELLEADHAGRGGDPDEYMAT